MRLLAFLFLFCNVNAKDIKHPRPNWENQVGACEEPMPQYLARKSLNRKDCEIIKDGVFAWVYYDRQPQYALKKDMDGEHFLPHAWFRDNCFYNRSFEEFKKAYNEEFNLITAHKEENMDKSDWVCNKKGRKYEKFLSKITAEKQKELCDKQLEVCLLFNKNYNNACGNKCKDLRYGN